MRKTLLLLVVVVGSMTIGLAVHSQKSKEIATAKVNAMASVDSSEEGKGILKYIDADTGEVDVRMIEDMASRIPSILHNEALSRATQRIDDAVSDGRITGDQADQLRGALQEALK